MKIQKTFTIDKEIINDFNEISKKTSLNKSLFVENAIKDYIKKYKENNDKK
ncbi:MAG: ribbon-helix-helix domain-containing protein [Candidatus Muirbacterium halophilum]|nr:ribbon-helix-helix domain-containing protein [Candidatus Muirbacterium halophilum]